MEIFGSAYVIEHVIAEHNIRVNEENYKSYTSDVLMSIAQFLGIHIPCRFADINKVDNDDSNLTGDEIALEVIKKCGLKGKINGCTETESHVGA